MRDPLQWEAGAFDWLYAWVGVLLYEKVSIAVLWYLPTWGLGLRVEFDDPETLFTVIAQVGPFQIGAEWIE